MRIRKGNKMTTKEFVEKNMNKALIAKERAVNNNAPKGDLQNITEKIEHWQTLLSLIEGSDER